MNSSNLYIINQPGYWYDQIIYVIYCFKVIYVSSIVIKVLMVFTKALSWLLLKVFEGIFIFGAKYTNNAYQIF